MTNGAVRDDQILRSLLQHRLRLSVKAIQVAKDAAWQDLPANERRTYLRHAEIAVKQDAKDRKPS